MEDDFDAELLDIVQSNDSTSAKRKKPQHKQRDSDDYEDGIRNNEDNDDDEDFLDENEKKLLDEVSESELDGLNELEREQFLSERAEKKQQLLERLEIKKRLGILDKKKTKRPKLESLVKERRKKKEGKNRKEEDEYFDEDEILDDGEDNDDEAYQSKIRSTFGKTFRSSKDVKITLNDLNGARLGRDLLERWCYAPWFRDIAEHSFVRLMVGLGEDKVPKYRVCEVAKVVEYHRAYKLGSITTKKALRLKHGKAEKVFLMDIISNSDFTESEFNRWVGTMIEEKVKFPLYAFLETRKEEIRDRTAHIFTSEEIDKIVDEKNASVPMPKNLAKEKLNLIAKMEEAETEGRFEDASEMRQQIAEIDLQSQDYESNGMSSNGEKKKDMWAKLNERNRKLNLEQGREAEKLLRQQRLVSQKSGKGLDPFARIKVTAGQDIIGSVVSKNISDPVSPATASSGQLTPTELNSASETKSGITNTNNDSSSAIDCKDAMGQALLQVDLDLDI